MEQRPDTVHIFPVTLTGQTDHITTNKRECWCDPKLMQPCPQTLFLDVHIKNEGNHHIGSSCTVACWQCLGKGIVPMFDKEKPAFLIHKEGQFFENLEKITKDNKNDPS